MFSLSFNTDNDAFQDDATRGQQYREIFNHVLERVVEGWTSGVIRDVNGNMIGKWFVSPDAAENQIK